MNATTGGREDNVLDRYFRFRQRGTTLGRDTAAGVTTFIVMSYIIFVNPQILGFSGIEGLQDAGLPFDAVLTSTCLVAGVMTIVMGLYTNMAYAIAPGLGLNAVVAFTLVANEGLTFPQAMGLVVVEGIAVTLLVLIGLREAVMNAIPLELKKAIAVGIGLFIAFIGLVNSGLVVRGAGTPVDLAEFTTWPVAVALFGLAITIVLRALRVRGDLLIGIVATTVFATILEAITDVYPADGPGWAKWPDDIVQSPDFSLVGEFSLSAFTSAEMGFVAAVLFAFSLFLADFFDTMGTLVGVGRQAGYVNRAGEMPEIRKPLLVDSVAAIAGGAASASSATTYIESASGVGVGGRTGWVSVVTGALFFPFMFFTPIIGMVPPQATAAALIIVGWLMISVLTELEDEADLAEGTDAPKTRGGGMKLAGIDFHDVAVGLSAALILMLMPFTFSITDGIGFGFVAYVIIRIAQGAAARVHPLMWAAAAAFALYFMIPLFQSQGWI